jgi:DNA/RNA endonuclease G (NUC1)
MKTIKKHKFEHKFYNKQQNRKQIERKQIERKQIGQRGQLNNLIKYTQILHGNHHFRQTINSKNLLFLKKREFDIFYSTTYKYPLLVAETITALTGKTDPNEPPIDRRIIEDPFRQDLDVPSNMQFTVEDYKEYMLYGGSMGHNAPAGQHKTNIDVYNDTFVLTNITPQEMVFNSGLWVLMENWCRNLGRNSKFEKIMVFTGSIPDKNDKVFNGVKMNVPSKMFKIICLKIQNRPDMTSMEIFICDNKPYSVNYNLNAIDLSPYLVSHKQLMEFQRESGIDIRHLLEYYGFNSNRIRSFRDHLNMEIYLNPGLKLQMNKSKWFGKLIYARTIDNLERQWLECQKYATEFGNMEFHEEYYKLAKHRLEENSKLLSVSSPIEYTLQHDKKTSKHNAVKSKKQTKSKTSSKTSSKTTTSKKNRTRS